MLDKAIQHGKDHRQLKYYGSRKACNFDLSCRPNGGCPYCESNRFHSNRKRERAADDKMKYG